MLHTWDSWISFDLDLPEGEYEVVVNLATQMDERSPGVYSYGWTALV